MFPPPGYSINDIIQAAKACKKVFEAFFDDYSNAPSRLRELSDLVTNYVHILSNHRDVIERYQTNYSGHEGLKRTLDELARFLGKFKSVTRLNGRTPEAVLRKVLWGLEGGLVEDLDRQLNRHTLPMILWNQNLMLKLSLDNGEVPALAQQPRIHLLEPEQGLGTPALHLSHDLHQADELKRFQKEMVDLQSRMAQRQAETPRPLERNVWRAIFYRECHDIVSHHWNKLGLPANELLDIFSEPQDGDLELPRSMPFTEIKQCRVIIYLESSSSEDHPPGTEQTKFSSIGYKIGEDDMKKTRVIIWYDEQERPIMRHDVPFGTYPYTHHSIYEHDFRKLRFLQQHALLIHRTWRYLDPEYEFFNDADCDRFQRLVRSRELLKTFNVNKIDCATGPLAQMQHLKIWRLHKADTMPTLSFFADRLDLVEKDSDPTFCELNIRLFESNPIHKGHGFLRLYFYKTPEEQSRRRLSLSERWFRRKSSTHISPISPRSSISGGRLPASLYNLTEHTPLPATEESFMEMQYLDIDFEDQAAHPTLGPSTNHHLSINSDASPTEDDQSRARLPGFKSSSIPEDMESPNVSTPFEQSPVASFQNLTVSGSSNPQDVERNAASMPSASAVRTEAASAQRESGFRLPDPAMDLPSPSLTIPTTPGLTDAPTLSLHSSRATPSTITMVPCLPPLELPPSGFAAEEFEAWGGFNKEPN